MFFVLRIPVALEENLGKYILSLVINASILLSQWQVFSNIEEYVPGFIDSIIGMEVLTPPDLDEICGVVQILTSQKPHIPASFNMYLVINKCVTAVKVSNFSGHYVRNRSTLDIGVLGYIGIVQHKEHSPEVLSIPPGTPCI